MKRALFLFALVVYIAYMSSAIVGIARAGGDMTPAPEQTEAAPVPPVPTAVATIEPTPVVNPTPEQPPAPSDRTIYVIGLFAFTVFAGLFTFLQNRRVGDLIVTVNKALDNKQVQDEAHERYMQTSVTVQQAILFAEAFFKLAGGLNIPGIDPLIDKVAEFGDKVTSQNGVVG